MKQDVACPAVAGDPRETLEARLRDGAPRRWPAPLPEAVRARLDEERAWLRAKPAVWPRAFLLALDRFSAARARGAAIAPCRGAAAGCAMAYALGLTDLDPLAHGLRPEPFFFRDAPTFPLETDSRVACDVRRWARRLLFADQSPGPDLFGFDPTEPPEHSDARDALDETRRLLDAHRAVGHPLDPAGLPLDDLAAFDALAAGDADGLPGFRAPALCDALRGLRPRSLGDLACLYALTLPGPNLFLDAFMRRRADAAPRGAAATPWLAALAETPGFLLWQEQTLALLRDLAGFPAETAWKTLRALLKGNHAAHRRARHSFVKGCLANPSFAPALPILRSLLPDDDLPAGAAPATHARRLWDDLFFFAPTLYPKSHALARALLAYRLLCLRTLPPPGRTPKGSPPAPSKGRPRNP